MDDNDSPNLSLGDLTDITDDRYQADQSAWGVLRTLLKPKGWDEETRFNGPRPPKETSKFYLILSNYSAESFFLEANRYPRYPPNPHSRNWLINLARRVEDHVIRVVKDIEESTHEKSFSYHAVTENKMREVIRESIEQVMKDRFPVEFPRSIPPRRAITAEGLRRSGIDPDSTSPVLQMAISLALGEPANPLLAPPQTGPSFGEELNRLLCEKSIRPEDLADKMEIEYSTVYRHISGKNAPNRRTFKRYLEALTGILGYRVKLPMPAKRQRVKRKK